jgi:heme-binding protein
MRVPWKKVAIAIVVVFGAAQLFRIDRQNPPVETELAAPESVRKALRGACYDCHSNETTWPWYSHVAPVSWLLAHDVSEGREELNFSTWQRYDAKRRAKSWKETIEEIEDGDMPPWYYAMLHPPARLAEAERAAIVAFANQQMAGDTAGQ